MVSNIINDNLNKSVENNCWLDLENPTKDDYEYLKNTFSFHDLHLDHCVNKIKSVKMEENSEYIFLVIALLNGNVSAESSLHTSNVYVFLGENFIVTIHDDENEMIEDIKKEVKCGQGYLNKGYDFILYSILNSVVYKYFEIIEKLESQIDYIEEELMEKTTKDELRKIVSVKKKVLKVRKNIYPTREMLRTFIRFDNKIIKDENKIYFSDVYDHLFLIHEMVEADKEILSSALELYSSQLSNKTNDVMKLLTVITTIMMPITVITGIYGMNFKYMPELDFKYGYIIVIVVILLSIILQLRYFKKKNWL